MLHLAALALALLPQTDDPDALFQSGRFEAAAAGYSRRVEADAEDAVAWYRLGYSLHAIGDYARAAEAHVRAAGFPGSTQSAAAYNAACAFALLDESDPAVEWLERAIDLGFSNAALVDQDSDLASLRDDPRFHALHRRLHEAVTFRALRPLPPGDASQFDFWIGEWNTAVWTPDSTGAWVPSGELTMKVAKVAGGEAVVEWAEGSIGGGRTLGFSLRSYDPAAGTWTLLLNWPSPSASVFSALRGGFRHGRGEFVYPPQGSGAFSQTRFTFSDVGPDRLRWDGASTSDGGKSWSTNLLFEFTRRAPDADPLPNGPSRGTAHAPGEEFRALDFVLGEWTGERSGPDGERPVALRARPVMEGSAVVLEASVGDGAGGRVETFRILALDPNRGAWVSYAVEEGDPRFERREGTPEGRAIRLVGSPGPGSAGADGEERWRLEGETLVRERVGVWEETLVRR